MRRVKVFRRRVVIAQRGKDGHMPAEDLGQTVKETACAVLDEVMRIAEQVIMHDQVARTQAHVVAVRPAHMPDGFVRAANERPWRIARIVAPVVRGRRDIRARHHAVRDGLGPQVLVGTDRVAAVARLAKGAVAFAADHVPPVDVQIRDVQHTQELALIERLLRTFLLLVPPLHRIVGRLRGPVEPVVQKVVRQDLRRVLAKVEGHSRTHERSIRRAPRKVAIAHHLANRSTVHVA